MVRKLITFFCSIMICKLILIILGLCMLSVHRVMVNGKKEGGKIVVAGKKDFIIEEVITRFSADPRKLVF